MNVYICILQFRIDIELKYLIRLFVCLSVSLFLVRSVSFVES